jgi:hypothetical protein
MQLNINQDRLHTPLNSNNIVILKVPRGEIPPSQVAMLRTLREKEAMKNDASLLTTPNFYTKEYSAKHGLEELIDVTMQKAGKGIKYLDEGKDECY